MTTVDDTQAEQLASKATAAAQLTSSSATDIQSLYNTALSQRTRDEQQQDDQYLSLAPTFLSLHQQASSSKQLLSSLESFLSTFQSDLSTLSTHISALQNTSHQIDSRLDATRDVEIQLASFLADIALSPRIVDLFFETEPESRPELWQKAVKQLDRVLDATSPSATLPLPPPSGDAVSDAVAVDDVQAVKEVRAVAEACRNVVASKLRTYLIAPHASIKSSVTTNLQVLQTSVLLRHHRPLYSFLARQMPRVAIDVQRSYVAAARLYFETAFRRYARSLGVVRKRWAEPGSSSLITDPVPSSASGGGGYATTAIAELQSSMATLSRNATGGASASFLPPSARHGSNTPTKDASSSTSDADAMSSHTDPWLFSASRLQYARLESNAATVLGYLADDASFKACPENLFRSLSLVLLDNACSEYTFLVRFFEGIGSEDDHDAKATRGEGAKSSATSTPGGGGVGVGPDESASVTGADDSTLGAGGVDDEAGGAEATVVQLSAAEQRRLRGRGASDEIFKQVMEPSVSTWVTFTKTLLTPSTSAGASLAASATSVVSSTVSGGSGGAGGGGAAGSVASTPGGYFALLSMLQLNDSLLDMLKARGCSNGLIEGALMGFKIQAYPLVKRFLDDQISALSHLASSPAASASASGMWGMLSFATSSSSTASSSSSSLILTPALAETIAIRYTSLFTKTLWILSDSLDQGIFSALTRLRAELAKVITNSSKDSAKWSPRDRAASVRTLMEAIEAVLSVTSLASHPKVQNEFSFWNETLKSIPT